jgi:hypothetical protein
MLEFALTDHIGRFAPATARRSLPAQPAPEPQVAARRIERYFDMPWGQLLRDFLS